MGAEEKQVYAPISDEELNEILNKYVDWLAFGEPWGERAFLDKRDLVGRDFRREYLKRANFEGANLEFANLMESRLQEACIAGAYLRRANLKNTVVWGAHAMSLT